jgi:hypothetical protein
MPSTLLAFHICFGTQASKVQPYYLHTAHSRLPAIPTLVSVPLVWSHLPTSAQVSPRLDTVGAYSVITVSSGTVPGPGF